MIHETNNQRDGPFAQEMELLKKGELPEDQLIAIAQQLSIPIPEQIATVDP